MAWTTPVTQPTGTLITAAIWNAQVADNITYLKANELAYNEFTAAVSIAATTEATATTVVTASAVTFDGATPALITFYSPSITLPPVSAVPLRVIVLDGATVVGVLSYRQRGTDTTTDASDAEMHVTRRLTPSAAAHTYSIRAWVGSGTGNIIAGAGGAAAYLPGYIRITKV
jgi:hypothetical protein